MRDIEFIILCVHFGKADPKKTKAKIKDMQKLAWEREKLILPVDRDFSLEEKFYGDYEYYRQNVEKMFAFFADKTIPNVFMVLTDEEYSTRSFKPNFGFEFPISGVMASDDYIDGSEAVPTKVIMNNSEKTTLSYKDFSDFLFLSTHVRIAYMMGEHLWWDRSLAMKQLYEALVSSKSDFVSSIDTKTGKKVTYDKYDVLKLRVEEVEHKKKENLFSVMRGCLAYNAEMFKYFGARAGFTPDGFKIGGELNPLERKAIGENYRSVRGIPGCIYPTAVLKQSNPGEYFPQNYSAFMKQVSTDPKQIIPEGGAVALMHPVINEIYKHMEVSTPESIRQELLKSIIR